MEFYKYESGDFYWNVVVLSSTVVGNMFSTYNQRGYSSLILGIVAGVLMYTGFNPWQAFLAFYDIMKNSMNLNILIFDIMLGVVIVLMVESGAQEPMESGLLKK